MSEEMDIFMDAPSSPITCLPGPPTPMSRASRSRTQTVRAPSASPRRMPLTPSSAQPVHKRNQFSVSAVSLSTLDVEALLDSCDLDELDWPAQALAEECSSSEEEEEEESEDPERTPRPAQKFVEPSSPTRASASPAFLLAPEIVSPIKRTLVDLASPPLPTSASFPTPPARSQISCELLTALQLASPNHLAKITASPFLPLQSSTTPPSLPPKDSCSTPMRRGFSDSQVAGNRMLTALHSSMSSLRSAPVSTPPQSPELASNTSTPLRSSVRSSSSHGSSAVNSFRWSSATDDTNYTVPSLSSSHRSSTSASRKGSIGGDSFASLARTGSISSLYGSQSCVIAEYPLDEEAATEYLQHAQKPMWSDIIDQHFSAFEPPSVQPLVLPPRQASISPPRLQKSSPSSDVSLSPPRSIRSRTTSATSTVKQSGPSIAPPTLKSKKSFANIFGIRKQSSVASLRTLHGSDAPVSPPRKSSLAPSKRL